MRTAISADRLQRLRRIVRYSDEDLRRYMERVDPYDAGAGGAEYVIWSLFGVDVYEVQDLARQFGDHPRYGRLIRAARSRLNRLMTQLNVALLPMSCGMQVDEATAQRAAEAILNAQPPTYQWLAQFATGAERFPAATTLANRIAKVGGFRRLERLMEETPGRVWFIARDADLLYAYATAIGYERKARYLFGFNLESLQDRPALLAEVARRLMRPGDVTVDMGYRGRIQLLIREATGVPGALLVTSNPRFVSLAQVDDVAAWVRPLQWMESLGLGRLQDGTPDKRLFDEEVPGVRANEVYWRNDVPVLRWDQHLLPRHADFSMQFVNASMSRR